MELGHLLTRSGLTYPKVSSKVCYDSFCQLENRVYLIHLFSDLAEFRYKVDFIYFQIRTAAF